MAAAGNDMDVNISPCLPWQWKFSMEERVGKRTGAEVRRGQIGEKGNTGAVNAEITRFSGGPDWVCRMRVPPPNSNMSLCEAKMKWQVTNFSGTNRQTQWCLTAYFDVVLSYICFNFFSCAPSISNKISNF